MKPSSRNQLRDRLGRFARAGRGPARLVALAIRADLARRLWRLALLSVLLAATVVLLYQHGDGPGPQRGAQPAVAAVSAAGQPSRDDAAPAHAAGPAAPAPPKPGASGAAPARGRAGDGRGSAAQADRAASPAAVAAAWYARHERIEPSSVRPLQQDRVSGREVRVLVLADRGRGRIDTALVTVRRDAAGRWAVR